MSSPTMTSPPDIWAGKSRNAKAQARHRAKRKAYIEQLEQTVSKLQTTLALSAEDVSNLPTTQIKLRELKEENDSLRAELRKLQLQQAANFSLSSAMPLQHNVPSTDELRRYAKRRRLSSDNEEQHYTYLDSVGNGIEPVFTPVPSSNHTMSLSNSIQNRNYHLQGPGGMTIPETSPLRDEPFTWSSYIPPPPPPPPPQADSPSWSYSGGHARNRSTSSTSSASSDTAPTPYMIPSQFHDRQPSESPFPPSKHSPMGDIPPPIQVKPVGKLEMNAVTPDAVSFYTADSEASAKRNERAINTLCISSNGPWSDMQVWPYSTVRAF